MDEMDEVIGEFLIECAESLEVLDRGFVELESNPSSPEILASIFRTVHTIKGTAGFLGFDKLGALTHVGENLLSRLRDGELSLTVAMTDALLAMVDAIRDMTDSVAANGTDGDEDFAELVVLLDAFSRADQSELDDLMGADDAVATDEVELDEIDSVEVEPDEVDAAEAETLEVAVDTVEEYLTDEELEQAVDMPDAFEASDEHEIEFAPEPEPEPVVETTDAKIERTEDTVAARRKTEQPTNGDAPSAVKEEETAAAAAPTASATVESSIRVDVKLLDRLMNLVGELVLARNQILLHTEQAEDAGLFTTSQQLNLITTELQENVMKTRMQPIGNVWNKFPRVVRDLATACGKQVRIQMEGEDTELDKTILEAIKDPLTHVVRNSVDHGIETPAERVAAGKPAEGTLKLWAFHEGGHVIIEISDDGAGLDVERIKHRAVERGVVTADAAAQMSDWEASNLIFLPGFSTAETVTNVSGRGVGMDVVKTNVERIGGSVDVSSVPGSGTTLRVKIPLTLAIIPALIVTCAGARYAIPQVNVAELVRTDDTKRRLEYVSERPVLRLRGQLLPIIYLSDVLGHPTHPAADGVESIVVLQADGRHFGLVVDGINVTQEIVVKPLGQHLKTVSIFAGTTIMGDGGVALILDTTGTAYAGGLAQSALDQTTITSEREGGESRKTVNLLVCNVGDARIGIPLVLIDRLEEFTPDRVERSKHRDVVQYRGSLLQLIYMDQQLGTVGNRQGDNLQVLVHHNGDRHYGFVVDEIVDIIESEVDEYGDGETTADGQVTQVVGRRVTDVLNIAKFITDAGRAAAMDEIDEFHSLDELEGMMA